VVSADQQPNFRTISEFRRIHLAGLKNLFVQVLHLGRGAGLVKLGHVALDGTKVKANASKHKAMSYERLEVKEPEYAREVEELLKRAAAADEEEDKRYGRELRVLVQRELDKGHTLVSNFRQPDAAGSSPGALPQTPEFC
jgi:hypothetical protein